MGLHFTFVYWQKKRKENEAEQRIVDKSTLRCLINQNPTMAAFGKISLQNSGMNFACR